MFNLGLIRSNAEIVDVQNKGTTTILTVQAVGVTKRSAKRGARKEASSLIPIYDQTVVNSTKIRGTNRQGKWLFTISSE